MSRGTNLGEHQILFRDSNRVAELLPVSEIPLKGKHNLENVLAAACAGVLMGSSPEHIRTAVARFKTV